MSMSSEMPHELLRACEAWASGLEDCPNDGARRDFMREGLLRLLQQKALLEEILGNIASGARYPEIHRQTLFPNEIVLYIDDRRLFSLRMLLAEPGSYTPIHDHNAWGVIAPFVGLLEVIEYEKPGAEDGEPRPILRERLRRTLRPGETADVLPLDEGIHRTGNSGEDILVMISVYGRPVRRPFVLEYDLDRGRILPIYTPRTRKRMLAREALEGRAETLLR